MQNLDKRVAALERVARPDSAITIIRCIVSPDRPTTQIGHIRDKEGNEWVREPGETEDQLTDRAERETVANEWGCKSLIAASLELCRV